MTAPSPPAGEKQPRDAANWAVTRNVLRVSEVPARAVRMREEVRLEKVCVDPKLQWSRVGNLWHKAGARSVIYTIDAPVAYGVRALIQCRNA
jgi:hypothetical protein